MFFEKQGGLFLARARGYSVRLESDGYDVVTNSTSISARLLGASAPNIRPENKQDGKVHYIRGDQSVTNIPTYARVRYESVYPGIDLLYYGNESQLEYDFIVEAGSDPTAIRIQFEGVDNIAFDDAGNLILDTIIQHKPIAYQDVAGVRREVESRYRFVSPDTLSFEIGSYDPAHVLIIDPILSYSTYIGGSNGDDDARSVAVDDAGNIYIAGATTSTNFPTRSPFQANARSQDPEEGLSDAFVTKLNAAGNALIYSTYIGGTSDDDAIAIAVDSSGNAVVAGTTSSASDFPTTAGALRRTCNTASSGTCLDAFVLKLNAAGSALVFSTYLGGTGDDESRSVAVDGSGNAYVTGRTTSTNFTTTSGAFSTDSSTGAFVTKLSATGAVVYSTYFGAGTGTTEPRGIAVDSAGNAYITGATPSSTATATDVFVTKLNTTGTAAVYSQFIRGSNDESGNAIAIDSSGNAYVAGQTSSLNFTTTAGVIQGTFGGGPTFRSSDSGSNWIPNNSGLTRRSLYALAVAPGNPATLYAGADDETTGGVFKSSDGGATWSASSTGLSDTRVHALAIDPSSAATIYAGTRSAGVFKSTNGGATWSATALANIFVTALAIDPVTPNTIYAGTDASGVYKSTNAGTSWSPAGNSQLNVGVRTIAINPSAPATLYAGTGGGIYKSTDAGATWSSASSGLFDPNINVLVLDPRNPNQLYAGTNSVGVFRSSNAGVFWLSSNSGFVSSSLGILVSALTLDPATGTLYAATGESNVSRIYKSTNGINWTATNLSTARVTSLAVNSANSANVFAATVGGTDAFVAKWNAAGSLAFSTFAGGYRDDAANAIAVDSSGTIYIAGDTSSTNFPSSNALQTGFGGGSDVVTDAFVTKLNTTGTSISYSTYLGGTSNDFGKDIAVDASGNAIVAGVTGSVDFPTASALTGTAAGLLDAFVAKIADTNTVSFSVSARGGVATSTQGASSSIAVGYGRVQPSGSSTVPSALAIFGFRQGNVLVSEAAVPASTTITAGRFYAEVGAGVNTGVAIANPNSTAATINFYFTDRNGQNFGSGSTTIGADGQIAKFLNEAPFNGGASLLDSTFTFTSSLPVAAIALRGFTNERSEFLITTLPVADLSAAAGTETILFPHFADGGGWTTQILLVNTTDAAMSGAVQFPGSSVDYTIPARSAVKARTAGTAATVTTGAVRVVPSGTSRMPVGVVVFSFRNAGITVTEAGVPSLRAASAFRLYAESSGVAGQIGSIQTGVAVANPSAAAANVTFELTTLNGTSTGLTGSATVPANGQVAMFLGQIQGFGALASPFQGVLRVSTSAPAGISVVGLRGRYNERGDFLITTTQPNDESRAATTAEQIFPHLADGGGYTTQFILFNGSSDQSSSGSIRFFTQSGQSMSVSVR